MESMPWWFWIVLWVAVVAASLAYLGWRVYRVILKGAAAFVELSLLNDTLVEPWESSVKTPKKIEGSRKSAVFSPVSQAFAEYEQGKQTRRNMRVSRRINKRDVLGQPQLVGDLRIQARKGAQDVR